MRRRTFITLLGGAAVAWPVTASAQKAERERRIGVLMHLPENDPEAQARIRALLHGLQQLGWTEGRNLRIDYRFGAADVDRARAGRHPGFRNGSNGSSARSDPHSADRVRAGP